MRFNQFFFKSLMMPMDYIIISINIIYNKFRRYCSNQINKRLCSIFFKYIHYQHIPEGGHSTIRRTHFNEFQFFFFDFFVPNNFFSVQFGFFFELIENVKNRHILILVRLLIVLLYEFFIVFLYESFRLISYQHLIGN